MDYKTDIKTKAEDLANYVRDMAIEKGLDERFVENTVPKIRAAKLDAYEIADLFSDSNVTERFDLPYMEFLAESKGTFRLMRRILRKSLTREEVSTLEKTVYSFFKVYQRSKSQQTIERINGFLNGLDSYLAKSKGTLNDYIAEQIASSYNSSETHALNGKSAAIKEPMPLGKQGITGLGASGGLMEDN